MKNATPRTRPTSSDVSRLQVAEGRRADELRQALLERRRDPARDLSRREAATLSRMLTRTTAVLEAPVTRLLGTDGQPVDIRARAAAGGTGEFEGYAVLWDVVDAYGTRFAPGSAGAGGLDGDPYALLWMHDPTQVIGQFTGREDERGLWIAGGWDPTPEGQAARARAASGSAPGLSVGFVPLMLDPDDESRFTQIRLVETSQITARMAAVPGAGFASVRSTLARGVPGQETEDAPVDHRAAVAGALLALTERVR